MRNLFVAAPILGACVLLAAAMLAAAPTPDKVYNFPVTLHSYPMAATLTVHEDAHTWSCHMIADLAHMPARAILQEVDQTFSGNYFDRGNERVFVLAYAGTRIVFKRDGDALTFVSATVHFNMAKTPVRPE